MHCIGALVCVCTHSRGFDGMLARLVKHAGILYEIYGSLQWPCEIVSKHQAFAQHGVLFCIS